MRTEIFECLNCDAEIECPVDYDEFGYANMEVPNFCPECGSSLDYPVAHYREDFHSDG